MDLWQHLMSKGVYGMADKHNRKPTLLEKRLAEANKTITEKNSQILDLQELVANQNEQICDMQELVTEGGNL